MEINLEMAKDYAISRHRERNHYYGNFEYSYHLQQVADIAQSVLPKEHEYYTALIAACWAHDVIEDCHVTYNDLQKILGAHVADIVYAVSNEKGKTRKERAMRTYPGIAEMEDAIFVKLCDRIANTRHSFETGSSKINTYTQEYPYFKHMLYREHYENKAIYKLWIILEELMN